jgi:arsenate reductase
MTNIQIYHHKRCTKSNQALNYIKEKGFKENEIDVVLYMENPISTKTAEQLVNLFEDNLEELIRKPDAKALGIEVPKTLTKQWVIENIVKEPKIMQRPIVIADKKAVIARPTEKINEIVV